VALTAGQSDNSAAPGFLQTWVRTPFHATLTTFVALIAGLLGSVYAEDIKSSFPLAWTGLTEWSWTALSFWIFAAVFCVLFWARQRSDDEARDALVATTAGLASTTTSVAAKADEIRKFVQTLPPVTFRTQLSALGRTAMTVADTVAPRFLHPDRTSDELTNAIQTLLRSIATLAWVFDKEPHDGDVRVPYACNVMVFVPINAAGPPFSNTVIEKLKFVERTAVGALMGALELRREFSASTAHRDGPDVEVPELALPVPRTVLDAYGRFVVLPGAPRAFLTGKTDGYTDSADLAKWCEEKGDFLKAVVDDLRAYFSETGTGNRAASFLSRPLQRAGNTFAVMNLHAAKAGIVGPEGDRRIEFLLMMEPFFGLLESLLILAVPADIDQRT
jgi:hypothetical protein